MPRPMLAITGEQRGNPAKRRLGMIPLSRYRNSGARWLMRRGDAIPAAAGIQMRRCKVVCVHRTKCSPTEIDE